MDSTFLAPAAPASTYVKLESHIANITQRAQDKVAQLLADKAKNAASLDIDWSTVSLGPPRLPLHSNHAYVNPQEEEMLWAKLVAVDPRNPAHLKYYEALSTTHIARSFWAKVSLPLHSASLIESCWLWTAATHSTNLTPLFSYRSMDMDGKLSKLNTVTGAQLSFTLYTGRIPYSKLRAACGNKLCVSPFHVAPHVQIPKLKIPRGRKKAGWVNPNLDLLRHRPAPVNPPNPFDKRSQLGKLRSEMLTSVCKANPGMTIYDARSVVLELVLSNFGKLVRPV